MPYLFTTKKNRALAKSTREPCRLASTTNIDLSSTVTTMDTVALSDGNRVLLKDQTARAENGIYVWSSVTQKLTLADDWKTAFDGLRVAIGEGDTQRDTLWVLSTNDPITVGVTELTFILSGGGAMQTAFTVGPVSQGFAYPDIPSAVADAEATNPTEDNPALILLAPGTYADAVDITKPNLIFEAFAPTLPLWQARTEGISITRPLMVKITGLWRFNTVAGSSGAGLLGFKGLEWTTTPLFEPVGAYLHAFFDHCKADSIDLEGGDATHIGKAHFDACVLGGSGGNNLGFNASYWKIEVQSTALLQSVLGDTASYASNLDLFVDSASYIMGGLLFSTSTNVELHCRHAANGALVDLAATTEVHFETSYVGSSNTGSNPNVTGVANASVWPYGRGLKLHGNLINETYTYIVVGEVEDQERFANYGSLDHAINSANRSSASTLPMIIRLLTGRHILNAEFSLPGGYLTITGSTGIVERPDWGDTSRQNTEIQANFVFPNVGSAHWLAFENVRMLPKDTTKPIINGQNPSWENIYLRNVSMDAGSVSAPLIQMLEGELQMINCRIEASSISGGQALIEYGAANNRNLFAYESTLIYGSNTGPTLQHKGFGEFHLVDCELTGAIDVGSSILLIRGGVYRRHGTTLALFKGNSDIYLDNLTCAFRGSGSEDDIDGTGTLYLGSIDTDGWWQTSQPPLKIGSSITISPLSSSQTTAILANRMLGDQFLISNTATILGLNTTTRIHVVNYTATGAVTLNLPNSTQTQSASTGTFITVIDGGNNASVNNITVQVTSAVNTIDGASTFVMDRDRQVEVFYFDGTEWKRLDPTRPAMIKTTGALPTAAASYRGAFGVIEGGAGVADLAYICLKSAGDTYSWVQIAIG